MGLEGLNNKEDIMFRRIRAKLALDFLELVIHCYIISRCNDISSCVSKDAESVSPLKAWQMMCRMPRPGCWISRSKNLLLCSGRYIQLFTSGDIEDLSQVNFFFGVGGCTIGPVIVGAGVRLAKLSWCSSDIVCVLRFLFRILDLQVRQMCQWVIQLLGHDTETIVEPEVGGGYIPFVLQSKHGKQLTGLREDIRIARREE